MVAAAAAAAAAAAIVSNNNDSNSNCSTYECNYNCWRLCVADYYRYYLKADVHILAGYVSVWQL